MSKLCILKRTIQTRFQLAVCICLVALLFMAVETSRAVAVNIDDDLLLNGGFEQSELDIPSGWAAMGGWGNSEITLSTDAARTGVNGMTIETAQNTNPWIVQVVPYEAGATYDISTWLKAAGVQGSGVGFKLEYYRGNEVISGNHILEYDKTHILASGLLTGEWQKFNVQDTAPPESGLVKVYMRLYGTGKVYFDDASFLLRKHKPMIEMKTDQIFYYSNATNGQVSASFNSSDGLLIDKHVEVRIYRESTNVTLAEYSLSAAEESLAFSFDPSLMVKAEPYRVQVQLLDNSNGLIETAEETIYRYDRPSMLAEDGTILVDGEPFFPVGAYHVGQSDYPYLGEAGVNAVQGSGTKNAEVLQQELDAAELNGLKLMVPLYNGMKVQENAAMTHEFVTRFKDHPAVLAWMIMDEPILNGKTKQELIDANRIIRSIDNKHPVYMVEAPISWAYDTTAKLTDIFATDYYPLPNLPISLVGEHTVLGKEAAGEGKPVWTVLQAMYNQNHPYLPTIDEVRNMAYQSILNGAQGLAYYSVNEGTFRLRDSVLWPGLVDFREELDLIGRLVTGAELLDKGQSEDSKWTLWKEGDDRYAMAVNTSGISQEVTIPLGLTGYHAELLYGDSRASINRQTDELKVLLEPEQSLIYQIFPYQALVVQTIDAVNLAIPLSADQQWNSKMQKLRSSLNSMLDELGSVEPNMGNVIKDAVKALKTVEQLVSHANGMMNGAAKEEMQSSLAQIKRFISPIIGSELEVDLELLGNLLVGSLQTNEASISLRNLANSNMGNIRLALEFPASFELEPLIQTISELHGNQTEEKEFEFQIAASVPEGRYRLAVNIDYEYKGTTVFVQKSIFYTYIELIHAKVEPPTITANKGGSYSFDVNIMNNVSRELQISLEGDSLPASMTMQLPGSFSLLGKEQTTLAGTIFLPPGAVEGEYEVTILIRADGEIVYSLPLSIKVSYNLLPNPGLEQPSAAGTEPVDWLMRQGSWVQNEVHSGQYAVSLVPDGGNVNNVINSAGFIPVEAGAKYLLSGWVKNESPTGLVRIGLREIRENKVTSVKYVWKNITPDTDWTYYEIEVTPGSTSKYLQVYLSSDIHTSGNAWFDDLYVREIVNP